MTPAQKAVIRHARVIVETVDPGTNGYCLCGRVEYNAHEWECPVRMMRVVLAHLDRWGHLSDAEVSYAMFAADKLYSEFRESQWASGECIACGASLFDRGHYEASGREWHYAKCPSVKLRKAWEKEYGQYGEEADR